MMMGNPMADNRQEPYSYGQNEGLLSPPAVGDSQEYNKQAGEIKQLQAVRDQLTALMSKATTDLNQG